MLETRSRVRATTPSWRSGPPGVEDAAMAAGLVALGDDGIDTGGDRLASFIESGGGRQQRDPGALQGGDHRRRRQAEVEADHGGPQLEEQRLHRRVGDEAGVDLADGRRRLDAEALEHRFQGVQPGALPRRVGYRGAVGEDVDVEGLVGQARELIDHPVGAGGVHGANGDRAKRAGGGDGRGPRGGGRPRHRRLDDRQLDAEPSQKVGHDGLISGPRDGSR